jgi:hypothetical protein
MNYSEEDPMYTRLDYQPYQIQNGDDIDLACETNCICDASVYQPIHLTEEILQRHFPDPDVITWFPLDAQPGVFNIYWEHPTFGEGEVRLNLRYVHELQHLLRMIKSDKEIQL